MNTRDAPDCDFGQLGIDGLKRHITFQPFWLDGGPGTIYTRERVVPDDCLALRLIVAPGARSGTSAELVLIRKKQRVIILNHECDRLPDIGLPLEKGDVLRLTVHDSSVSLAPPRIFGALVVTDRLALTRKVTP